MKQILFLNNDLKKIKNLTEMLYLAGVAKECKYSAKIEEFNNKDLETVITSFNPCYLFANIEIETFSNSMKLLAQLKGKYPKIKIIVNGTPFLTYNTNAIYENPFIDYVITSEPEFVLKDILNNVPEKEILGICYSENMQGVQNENRTLCENLEEFSFSAQELNKNKYNLIRVSKGCPIYDFCDLTSVIEGNKIRYRRVKNVIEEINQCIKMSKNKNFIFLGEVFSFDENWVKEFCNEIIDNKLKINWTIDLRANQTNEETFKLIKKAGCESVNINFQSANDDTLKFLDCGYTTTDIKTILQLLKKYNIKLNPKFYVGLPSDSKKTLEELFAFIKSHKLNNSKFLYPKPLPGTKFFAYAMINKLIDAPLIFENSKNEPYARTHELTKQDITHFYDQANNINRNLLKKFFTKKESDLN